MAQSWSSWRWHFRLVSSFVASGAIATFPTSALAQIVPDVTLPINSSVTTEGNNTEITGGTQAGSNLFHSFEQFSVPTGGTAYFNNALDIQNIISRVTGSSISNIDGLIRANGTANLFLLNPNGIIFGRNASLNIGGSILVSTASSLNFADGRQFSATNPQSTDLLTVSVPVGLQYGGSVGSILNQSRKTTTKVSEYPFTNEFNHTFQIPYSGERGLEVEFGKNLALVGGNVSLDNGILQASGGRVELGGLAEAGTVGLNGDGSLSFPNGVARANVLLTNGSEVNNFPGNSSRSVAINAGNINIFGRSFEDASVLGNITLNATGGVSLNEVELLAIGLESNIDIQAGSISLTNSRLRTIAFRGVSGNIFVQADNFVSSTRSFLDTTASYWGVSGNISVQANNFVSLEYSSLDTTSFGGVAGNVSVRADDFISFVGSGIAGFAGFGKSGSDVNIQAGSIFFTNSGVATNATSGASGSININALEDGFFSNSYLDTAAGYYARGGDININAGSSLSFADSTIVSASTSGSGQAGSIKIQSRSLSITDGSQLKTSATDESTGLGGDLKITTGQLIVQDGAEVSASSQGTGNAGNLKITARSILLDNKGKITAETASSNGGNITLQVQDLLLMRHGSQISTTAGTASGAGDGGNITIDTDLLVALKDSDILANAFEGRGGNVKISTQGLFLASDSDITASSQTGIDGVVEIITPDIKISSGLATLPVELVEVSELIAQGCSANVRSATSKFVFTGHGGLPPNPREALASDQPLADLGTPIQEQGNRTQVIPSTSSSTETPPTQLVEAQGWLIGANGEVVLTTQPVNATPHQSWLTAANCHTPQASS